MTRIALGIQYDGAAFSGWQSQPHGNTVQDMLEAALRQFAGVPLQTTVAGRTDAGVHARAQTVSTTLLSRVPAHKMVLAVGSQLPDDVSVVRAEIMPAACPRGTSTSEPSAWRMRSRFGPLRWNSMALPTTSASAFCRSFWSVIIMAEASAARGSGMP